VKVFGHLFHAPPTSLSVMAGPEMDFSATLCWVGLRVRPENSGPSSSIAGSHLPLFVKISGSCGRIQICNNKYGSGSSKQKALTDSHNAVKRLRQLLSSL